MPRLPALTPVKVIRALERAGFVLARQHGSHMMYVKGALRITVPFHNKDLRRGTLKHIIKQSGMTLEEFLKLL